MKRRIVEGLEEGFKAVPAAKKLLPEAPYALPYEGAKEMVFVEDRDDCEFLTQLLAAMYEELPTPKRKRINIMAFDYKKEYKEFYMPPKKPGIVTIPPMNYIAVRGNGDPNTENGQYKSSIGLLYGIAFTIKMSDKGDHKIDGYFQYVVPPLEGLWWQDGVDGIDYTHKENFNFISMIRLPDFVTKDEFDWAIAEATKKKNADFSSVEFLSYDEGKCVQCMHIGSYDDEPKTIAAMHEYAEKNGYVTDMSDTRYHHEIYLSDPRRCEVSKLKTVVRHPIKRILEEEGQKSLQT